MSIDLKFVELTADVLEIFFIKYKSILHARKHIPRTNFSADFLDNAESANAKQCHTSVETSRRDFFKAIISYLGQITDPH